MEQDDFLARKEQILNRNSAKNFKEFNIENELKKHSVRDFQRLPSMSTSGFHPTTPGSL